LDTTFPEGDAATVKISHIRKAKQFHHRAASPVVGRVMDFTVKVIGRPPVRDISKPGYLC
jgi:hypothetical protein